MTRRWRRAFAIVVLGLVSLVAARTDPPHGLLPAPASRFVHYYRALGDADVPVTVWERLVLSVVLASSKQPESKTLKAIGSSMPSS